MRDIERLEAFSCNKSTEKELTEQLNGFKKSYEREVGKGIKQTIKIIALEKEIGTIKSENSRIETELTNYKNFSTITKKDDWFFSRVGKIENKYYWYS